MPKYKVTTRLDNVRYSSKDNSFTYDETFESIHYKDHEPFWEFVSDQKKWRETQDKFLRNRTRKRPD